MINIDLRAAIAALKDGATLAFVNGNDSVTSREAGVGFLYSMVKEGKRFDGYSAADKIVGRASAFLMVALGIKCVYALTISRGAAAILDSYAIPYEYDVITDVIINRAGTDMCPMERATLDSRTPEEAFAALTIKLSDR